MNLSARKISVFLFLSLGLNLFFAGMLTVGCYKRLFVEPQRRPPGAADMLFRAGDAMGQGRHPRLRALLDRRKPALIAHRRAVRAARAEVRQALVADPLDEKRLTRSLEALRRETTRSQQLLHASLVEIARGMDPEQRQRLARFAISEKHRPRKNEQ